MMLLSSFSKLALSLCKIIVLFSSQSNVWPSASEPAGGEAATVFQEGGGRGTLALWPEGRVFS